MHLDVIIDEETVRVNVPDELVSEAEEVFGKMDRDMDGGWQMGPQWVEAPDVTQRCQIVANRLLTALVKENQTLAMMMAGYILSRRPEVCQVAVDPQGDMLATELITA